jgi:hypothetical protein
MNLEPFKQNPQPKDIANRAEKSAYNNQLLLTALFIGILIVNFIATNSNIEKSTFTNLTNTILVEILIILSFVLVLFIDSKKLNRNKLDVFSSCFLVAIPIIFCWGINYTKNFFILAGLSPEYLSLVIAVSTLTTLFLLGFFFFYIPFLYKNISYLNSFNSSMKLFPNPRLEAIKIFLRAILISLIFEQIALLIEILNLFSDNTIFAKKLLSSLGTSFYWFTITCSGLAYASFFIDSKDQIQINYKSINPVQKIAGLVAGKISTTFIIVTLLFIGTISTYITLNKPLNNNPTIVNWNYQNNSEAKSILKIKLSTESNKDFSFQPIYLRIAGDSGEPLSNFPNILETTTKDNLNIYELEFEIIERKDDFQQLKDKGLWYLNQKISNF